MKVSHIKIGLICVCLKAQEERHSGRLAIYYLWVAMCSMDTSMGAALLLGGLVTCRKPELFTLQSLMQEMEAKLSELQLENARLKRLNSLHKQRCCILEEACFQNEVHVPGGLLAYP